MIFYSRIHIFTAEISLLDQDGDLILGVKKRSITSCIYTVLEQESQGTKLILAS